MFCISSYSDCFNLLHKTGGANKGYKDSLYNMVNKLKAKYNLSGSYSKPMKEKMHQPEYTQLSLFDKDKNGVE